MPLTLIASQGDFLSNQLPDDTAFQYGGSSPVLTGGPIVLINKQNFAQSAPVNPAATGADNVLAVYTIPAGFFNSSGRAVKIHASGSVANNANTKTLKLIFNPSTAVVGSTVGSGGVTIATTGAYSTALASGWTMIAGVVKDGAAGTNTQTSFCADVRIGATSPNPTVPQAITATESGAILVCVTGNAATTASDIGLNLFVVTGRW